MENKCYICGSSDEQSELTTCERCGKIVCLYSESCCEILNDGDSHTCTECTKEMERFDCDKCKQEDCPFDNAYSFCYECEDYKEK